MKRGSRSTFNVLLPAHQIGSGGLGTSIRGICEHLPSHLPKGCSLTAIGVPDQYLASANHPELSVGPIRGSGVGKIQRHVHEQIKVAAAARHFDLLHLGDSRPILASRTPFVLTIYDVFYLDHPEWFPKEVHLFKRLMLKAAMKKRPLRIVAGSHYTRDRLLRWIPPEYEDRTAVIYPGLEPPPARTRFDKNEYFLTVSTVEPRKNHLTVLTAYRKARKAGLRLKWVVAGAPGYASRRITDALSGADGVEYRGKVSSAELEDLYAGASFVVIPSYAEGFGFPPLEAMQRGVPVACSYGSAFDETVGNAAIQAPADDVDGWARVLTQLADDLPQTASLVERGRERASAFGWEEAARKYAAFYAECITEIGR